MDKLIAAYRDDVTFLTVYIREAHPTDGWRMAWNDEFGIAAKQPKTYAQRAEIAEQCNSTLSLNCQMLIDSIDNKTERAYAAFPDRLYLINRAGKVVYKGGRGPVGYRPNELKRSIVMLLADQARQAELQAAEKPAAEKPAAEKPAAEKPAAEKPAAEKPAAEKPAAEKPAAEKPAAEKPAAEKPAAEKPAAASKANQPAAKPKASTAGAKNDQAKQTKPLKSQAQEEEESPERAAKKLPKPVPKPRSKPAAKTTASDKAAG